MTTSDDRPGDRRLGAVWLAAGVLLLGGPGLAHAASVQVTINADGTFSPQALTIASGDTVRWTFSDRMDSVIPAESPTKICAKIKPYEAGSFAGPMPEAVSGIFSLGPFDEGLVEVSAQEGCVLDNDGPRATSADGATVLCRDGALYETMRSTWENPAISGVFISIPWNKLHIHPGTDPSSFDFSLLDREINAAVQHGKLYSLAIEAGKDSIPDWVYAPYTLVRP